MVSKIFILLNCLCILPKNVVCHEVKMAPGLCLCASFCTTTSECSSFLYASENMDENCILQSNVGQSPPTPGRHYSTVMANLGNVVYQLVKNLDVQEEAINAGFNYWIIVNNTKIYFSKESQPTGFRDAIERCFLNGGILPMERTDEFIDAMSKLSNDSVTSRFTSLAREFTEENGTRHLTWTLGPKEWGEDEIGMNNPKFQEWPQTNYDSYLFQIDPTTKQYIPSSIEDIADYYYCQYVGNNLAKSKPVTTSSTHMHRTGSNAVDGVLGNSFWNAAMRSKNLPDWISVNLETMCIIQHVLWIGRPEGNPNKNRNVQVWVGNQFLASGSLWNDANVQTMSYCGIHPYSTTDTIVSGVTCAQEVNGQYVTLVNYDWHLFAGNAINAMHMGEIAIFGRPLATENS